MRTLDDDLMDIEMALSAARGQLVGLEAAKCRGDVPRANKVARPHMADAARVIDAALACLKEARYWLRPASIEPERPCLPKDTF